MQIQTIQLQNFRCFSNVNIALHSPRILISGLNGAGKTSLLEAIHYSCYLRSFRTHVPRELIYFDNQHFFIKIEIAQNQSLLQEIQIGFSGKKRLVKIDQKPVDSFKELFDCFRVITVTEDDLFIIKGGPEQRRSFIDQALLLHNPNFIMQLKRLKQIVQQRNALLVKQMNSEEMDQLWTKQLWYISAEIQKMRKNYLSHLLQRVNLLLQNWDTPIEVMVTYQAKHIVQDQSFDDFLLDNRSLFQQEQIMKRSLFGAHLDDFMLIFKGKSSKLYASRGQQKIFALLLRIAQLQELNQSGAEAVFLLDDFMNDFDQKTAEFLLSLIVSLPNQLIFTSPAPLSPFESKLLANHTVQHLILSG